MTAVRNAFVFAWLVDHGCVRRTTHCDPSIVTQCRGDVTRACRFVQNIQQAQGFNGAWTNRWHWQRNRCTTFNPVFNPVNGFRYPRAFRTAARSCCCYESVFWQQTPELQRAFPVRASSYRGAPPSRGHQVDSQGNSDRNNGWTSSPKKVNDRPWERSPIFAALSHLRSVFRFV